MTDFVKKLNERAKTHVFRSEYEPQFFYAWA